MTNIPTEPENGPPDSNIGMLVASLIIALGLAGYLIFVSPPQDKVITTAPNQDEQTTGTVGQ